jgi:ribose transport system substrate-binding protein
MASTESKLVDFAKNAPFPHPMSRRSFLSALAAAGVVVGVAACGDDSSPSSGGGGSKSSLTKDPTWCQVTTLSNDFFVAFADGGKQAMSALGVKVNTVEDGGNVNTAIGQVGNVKAGGGKSIFGTPATEAQAAAVTKACQAAGILYASSYTAPPWYTPADADQWIRFLTPPSVKIAEETARALFEKVGGSGTVIHVPGQKGSSADDQRTAGMKTALADYPGITIVTTPPGNWTSEDARKSFENTLPSVSDFVGVFAQNDSEATGVIAALDAQGIKGKVVTGFDGNKQNIEYIAAGKQYLTSATIGGLTAGLLGITAFDALNGVDFSLPERFMSQGALLVKPDSADTVLKTIYAGELPFEWEKMSRALNPDSWDPQTVLNPIDPNEYYAGVPQDDYQLSSDWDKADIAGVRSTYAAAFKSGPLYQFKDALVA